jgi:hypothetical protein
LPHQCAHAGGAAGDQGHVAEDAGDHHQADMAAQQALAQHERVLRADGDDQAGTGGQAGGSGGQQHAATPGRREGGQCWPAAVLKAS